MDTQFYVGERMNFYNLLGIVPVLCLVIIVGIKEGIRLQFLWASGFKELTQFYVTTVSQH
jgi:hypothetical protein